MNRKKFLIGAVFILILIGLLATCAPFVSSLNPNSSTLDSRPSINVKDLEVGKSLNFKTSWFHVFINKTSDQENPFKVFAIPYDGEKYLLPEFGWHRPVLPCIDFIQETTFQCKDTYEYEETKDLVWWSYMKWDKNGNYIGKQEYEKWGHVVPDLQSPKFKVVGSNVILLGN